MQPVASQSLPDLDFAGHDTLYATHGLHAFAAKCPPQLANFGILNYSSPGDLVLDPMAGSGTSLVEACLLGRSAIGFDIDPLACLIARVKSSEVDEQDVDEQAQFIVEQVNQDLGILKSGNVPDEVRQRAAPPDFPRRDYWFTSTVTDTLALLCFHIDNTPMPAIVKDFLWVAFSSVILSKVSVANARDIIHSRHHHFKHASDPDVMARFQTRVKIMQKKMAAFQDLCSQQAASAGFLSRVEIHQRDARQLPLESASVDLVLTSPPYATALDYPRAHFLAVAWMRPVLGLSMDEYMKRAPDYIGSERGRVEKTFQIAERLTKYPSAQAALESLKQSDLRQAHLIQRYFLDMALVLGEMKRVLKPQGHVFIVVCPSHVRRVQIPTHSIFTEMCQALDLNLVAQYQRTIDGNRRVLPYMREAFGDRMNTEYVLVYRKSETQ